MDGTDTLQDANLDNSGPGVQDVKGDDSAAKQGNSPRTYTQEEYDRAVQEAKTKGLSDALAKVGVKYKPIEEERNSLKAKVLTLESEIEDIKSEREELQSQIDDLAKDDPDKRILTQRLKSLKDAERKLKADRLNIDTEKAEVHRSRVEFTAERMAKEYNVDADVLKRIGDPETMEEVAKALGTKLTTAPAKDPASEPAKKIVSDSGVSSGGIGELRAGSIDKMSMDQLERHPDIKKLFG